MALEVRFTHLLDTGGRQELRLVAPAELRLQSGFPQHRVGRAIVGLQQQIRLVLDASVAPVQHAGEGVQILRSVRSLLV